MTRDLAELIEREVHIEARPETVFAFFTDPQKLMRWKGIQATLEPAPGGTFYVDLNGHDIDRGAYVEVIPFSRVVFRWGWEGEGSPLPPGTSTVEVTLLPEGAGTRVRLRHEDLPADQRDVHGRGWDHYLPRLVAVAEGRDPGPDPWATTRMGDPMADV